MDDMKKRIVLMVLASLTCTGIYAQRYFEANDIRYKVITDADEASTYGTVSVAKPEAGEYMDDIKIPNVVKESDDQYADAYKVIGIDEDAFVGTEHLESVELPSSLETIGKGAFKNSSIKKIIIPVGNLSEIGESVFEETKLKSIQLPTTIKRIGDRAFAYCFDLVDVVLGEGLTDLGKESFKCCYNLKNVSLPNSLRLIGDDCFCFCYCINKLIMGPNIKRIGNYAFYVCMSLRHVDLPEGLKEIGKGAFAKSGLFDIKIPESIRIINESVFANSMLHSVLLSQSLRSIEDGAFLGLYLNEPVIIPKGTIVAQDAFEKTIYNASVVQSEKIKYLKSHQKELIKVSVNNEDIRITRGDAIANRLPKFLVIIKGIAYYFNIIPTNSNEYGAMGMCGIQFSTVEGRGESFLSYTHCELSGDIIIPDIIEIKDGMWKGKYIVTEVGEVMEGRAVKSIRMPLLTKIQ